MDPVTCLPSFWHKSNMTEAPGRWKCDERGVANVWHIWEHSHVHTSSHYTPLTGSILYNVGSSWLLHWFWCGDHRPMGTQRRALPKPRSDSIHSTSQSSSYSGPYHNPSAPPYTSAHHSSTRGLTTTPPLPVTGPYQPPPVWPKLTKWTRKRGKGGERSCWQELPYQR